MIPNFERKVLSILYNYAWLPTIDELIIKTGHNKQRIREALLYLENAHYISWFDNMDTSSILSLLKDGSGSLLFLVTLTMILRKDVILVT